MKEKNTQDTVIVLTRPHIVRPLDAGIVNQQHYSGTYESCCRRTQQETLFCVKTIMLLYVVILYIVVTLLSGYFRRRNQDTKKPLTNMSYAWLANSQTTNTDF